MKLHTVNFGTLQIKVKVRVNYKIACFSATLLYSTMTLYIQLDILLYRRFAFVIYNIAYAFVSILLFHVLLLLNHLLPHAMFARHRGHGTLLRTKHQK
jgi:hypothetical protein